MRCRPGASQAQSLGVAHFHCWRQSHYCGFRGNASEGIQATVIFNPQKASRHPRAQLADANAKLSTNNCLMRRVRLAPRADRMPNSFSRVVARARSPDAHFTYEEEFSRLWNDERLAQLVPPPRPK